MNLYKKSVLRQYGAVFGLGLLTSFLFFLPFLIWDNGLFIYYGDFNVQQIPFYQMCHDSILSGNWMWNWYTDLGANFIGSYSFYLLGSPWFWLTLLFPSEAVPYLMAPLLMLKFATAAVTSYAYIRRFVKNPGYAVIGGLLYAFSGYSIYNIFFNHFHEVIAIFPLLLIGMEEFMVNNRRGAFALAVGACAFINYYFFFGEVIFAVMYFLFRAVYDRKNPYGFYVTWRKFLLLAFEAVLGLLLSACLLLPSLMAIVSNPRTSNFLFGWNGIFYGNVQRYGLILSSFFFPPDIPAYPNLFPDSNAKWSSVSAFLPLFSMSGVLTFFKCARRRWEKALFGLCIIFAFIPFLNSSFSAFNNAYYARWFFMFLLIMAMMTAVSLERYREHFSFGIKWTLIITMAFTVLAVFPSYENGVLTFGKLINYQERFWPYLIVSLMGLVLASFLVQLDGKAFFRVTAAAVCFVAIVMSVLMLALGKANPANAHRVSEMALKGSEKFSFLKDDPDDFYRIDLDNCMDNFPMYWKIPTIQAFHSVVPGSIFEFYDTIGYDRSVGSRPELEYDGLRLLTSVKYLLAYETETEDPDIAGFTYVTTENELKIYENENFIPMGFTYDYYVSEEALNSYTEKRRDRLMLAGIYLDDEAVARNSDILSPLPDEEYPVLTDEGLADLAAARNEHTCSSFTRDNTGFTATITLDRENLVFFSVPYDEGWSATVNGVPVLIEKANAGFMAVRVPEGESVIRFDYRTPGLTAGICITGGAAVLLLCYWLIIRRMRARKRALPYRPYAHLNAEYAPEELEAASAYSRRIAANIHAASLKEAKERKGSDES
ncbi:MAG TPA: YfhO family protein [Candidatus Merdivicinus faecavium]|nr:YfhO family protein [Candidatus Merdivicinus faecavium]